jgi:hypothetical protein
LFLPVGGAPFAVKGAGLLWVLLLTLTLAADLCT